MFKPQTISSRSERVMKTIVVWGVLLMLLVGMFSWHIPSTLAFYDIGQVGQLELGVESVNQIVVRGAYAYMAVTESLLGGAGSGQDFQIVDVSRDAVPALIGGVDLGFSVDRELLSSDGTHAYIYSNDDDAFHILDVSQPTAPVRVDKNGLPGCFPIAEKDKKVYCAAPGAEYAPDDFVIIDVSNVKNPRVSSRMTLGHGSAYSVWVKDERVYFQTTDLKFAITDIASGRPVRLGQTAALSRLDRALSPLGRSVFLSGNYAYLGMSNQSAGQSEIFIIEISNRTAPRVVGEIDTSEASGAVSGVWVRGNRLYATFEGVPNGLNVYDINTPDMVSEIARFDSQLGLTTGLQLTDNTIYVGTANYYRPPGERQQDFLTLDISGISNANPDELQVSPTSLTFNAPLGSSTPPAQTVRLTKRGPHDWNWTAIVDQRWCHVQPVSGRVTNADETISLSVSVDAADQVGAERATCTVVFDSGEGFYPLKKLIITYTTTDVPLTPNLAFVAATPCSQAGKPQIFLQYSANVRTNTERVDGIRLYRDGAVLFTDTSPPYAPPADAPGTRNYLDSGGLVADQVYMYTATAYRGSEQSPQTADLPVAAPYCGPRPNIIPRIVAVNNSNTFDIKQIKNGDLLKFSIVGQNVGYAAAVMANATVDLSDNLTYQPDSFSCTGTGCITTKPTTDRRLEFLAKDIQPVGKTGDQFTATFTAKLLTKTKQVREILSLTAEMTFQPGNASDTVTYSLVAIPQQTLKRPIFREISPK